ncbi:D-alanyl-D-alanine carboxypeptidase family protein [uncultured Eubacterium sp.]|uniref:D-alanyl-D-alanine carboxypeptidase family protein n=1 Tax=uncultured Eubacterium sp. TaxID=165185 RepID=UPI0025F7E853|nr:D-alanyl-D-alanine carboxypeptidase family protein [uncultured Eubacterium sp.]
MVTVVRNPEKVWQDSAEQFSDFHRENLNLYAKSAVLTDAETGRILYGKNAVTPMANASTTKIMTCLLAIESGKMGDTVTFSEYACKMPKVRLGCAEGTQFMLEDLLYSLMLESHNDTAVAIAEHVAGSVEDFAKQMNERAAELGCQNTHFVTPNGLDSSDAGGAHQTTAYDLSLIMAACIQNDKLLEITETASKTIASVDGTFQATLNNHNALLSMVDGVISGKTGFTAKAGYCYVGAYCNDDRVYTFALLACGWPNNKGYKWEDSRKLIAYGNETYARQLYTWEAKQKQIEIHNGVQTDRTGMTTEKQRHIFGKKQRYAYLEEFVAETEPIEQELLLSDTDMITDEWSLPDYLESPIQKGDVIGEHVIFLNGCQILTQPVYAAETVEKFDYRWCLNYVFSNIF